MLKMITLFLSVTMFLTGTIHAQTLSDSSTNQQMNLRQAIAKETEKLKQESAVVDAKKMEKSQRQQQQPQKFWTKRNTLIIIGVSVLIIGVVIIAAKNSKRCIRRTPTGCNFGDDINCECVEYAQ